MCELAANHEAVFSNFFFWAQHDFSDDGIDRIARDEVLMKLRTAWANGDYRDVPLGVAATTTTATSSG